MNKKTIIALVLLVIGTLIIGFATSQIYNGIKEVPQCKQRQYEGCWASVKSGEDRGDWVCVNVEGMEYERCVEVAVHECSHEIFAEKCENNKELCFDLMEVLENET